jgi:anti-sigma factor RsiW
MSDEDEMIDKVGDYLDGALSGADKEAVGKRIESDPAWKQTHEEMVEARKELSGLQKARAPGHFAADVTATIRKRSRGAFFSKHDRFLLPLTIVAVLALCVVAYVMWSAQPSSYSTHHEHQGSGVKLSPGL